MSWNEARIHAWLRQQPRPQGLYGSAMHDAAVLEALQGRPTVCVDQCVEGVHAVEGIAPGKLAAKVVLRTLSDLAATAAHPRAVVLALAAPRHASDADVRAAIRAARQAAQQYGCDLVAGDLSATDGPWHVTASALGESRLATPPGRDRAQVGDAVLVTGALGGSILARHLKPVPRFATGYLAMEHGAHALMDVSDGLVLDASRIALASQVQVRLELARIPVHAHARRLAAQDGMPPLEHALRDGEDHELLVCLPAADADDLCAASAATGVPLTRIGSVHAGTGLWLQRHDGTLESTRSSAGGWIHGG